MAVTVACECSSTFELKDEFAGTLVKCPKCGATTRAGGVTAVGARTATDDPVFARDLFLLRQKVSLNERYTVSDEQGLPLLFVERPVHLMRNLAALGAGMVVWFFMMMLLAAATDVLGDTLLGAVVGLLGFLFGTLAGLFAWLALSKKRHVSFHAGEGATAPKVLEVLQDHKIRFPTVTFTVLDDQGRRLGILSKNYLYNVFRKQWMIFDWRGKPVCRVKEDSIILSLLRRLLKAILPFMRTNFVFLQFGTDRELGEFKRKLTILDRYVLDLNADSTRTLDRRLAVATAVMLDTGERR